MESIKNSVIAIGVILAIGYKVYEFIKLPKDKQSEQIEEWLFWALFESELAFGGGGTGELKMRYVYDLFILAFPKIAESMPFAEFKSIAEDILPEAKAYWQDTDKLRNMLKEEETK